MRGLVIALRPAPLVLLLVFLLAPAATLATGEASRAGEPMSADPGDLLLWAGEAPAGAGVTVLWRDDRYVFDTDGRLTYHRHWIYVIRHVETLDAWSASEARWSPWHQERPRLRARVIGPDGSVAEVDSERVAVSLPEVEDPLDDQRLVLRLALPDVVVGSVIEEELVLRDREPLFAAGVTYRHPLVLPVPIAAGRLVLEAPTRLPLRYGLRLSPEVEPEQELLGERVRLRFDYDHQPAAAPIEPWQDGDAPRIPHVAFATGADWEQVGAAYHQLVLGALAEATPPPPVGEASTVEGPSNVEEHITELLTELRERVEPVRRPLEAAPLGPASPRRALERGRGDSEDLATLLVSRLAARGIPAHVALVAGGYGQDVEHSLPGLGLFDRALVYVPAGRALWIDPADPWSRAGELPAEVLDRWALVASPTVRQLIRTPEPKPEDHRSELTIDVHLADEGPARIVEQGVYHGEVERGQRRLAATLPQADRLRAYLDYARSAYLAREIGQWNDSDPADLGQPYRLEFEAKGAERGFTEGDTAAFAVLRRDLLLGLPRELLLEPTTERQTPFVFRLPFTSQRRIRIHPPPGFHPTNLPENATFSVGTGTFRQTFRVQGNTIEATLRFTTGEATQITPEQLAIYRQAARTLMLEDPLIIELQRTDESQLGREP